MPTIRFTVAAGEGLHLKFAIPLHSTDWSSLPDPRVIAPRIQNRLKVWKSEIEAP